MMAKTGKKLLFSRFIVPPRSFVPLARIEQLVRKVDAVIAQLLGEFRANSSGLEVAAYFSVAGDACLPERENFLHGDDVAFHARNLLDARDLALAIRQPID